MLFKLGYKINHTCCLQGVDCPKRPSSIAKSFTTSTPITKFKCLERCDNLLISGCEHRDPPSGKKKCYLHTKPISVERRGPLQDPNNPSCWRFERGSKDDSISVQVFLFI